MKKHTMTKIDVGDVYSSSDSEEEYTENEKRLLSKVRNRPKDESESENEVFGVQSGGSESDDDRSDIALSDVEGQDAEDDLPNVRAWGKDKRKYYNTDYVDQDYGGVQGKDAHLAELEEEEAKNLQKQLAEHLDQDDFELDLFSQKQVIEDEKVGKDVAKIDISKLSKSQKMQMLQKESPEFFSLVEDYQAKMSIAKEYLHPFLQKYKSGQVPKSQAIDFVETHYKIILNYCTNIYMYLFLKSSKINVQNHPVIKRLYQYRQLLLQLDPVFEEVIKEQVEDILSEKETEGQKKEVKKPKKKLKILETLINSSENTGKKKTTKQVTFSEDFELPAKKAKLDKKSLETNKKALQMNKKSLQTNKKIVEESESSEDEDIVEENVDKSKEETENDISKRAITYEMAKNKGLTPHRKKEQRNPRVKHKLKYRKAIIRRKGAVREPRKELTRYGGEISGIKATVSRSIKIKS